MFLTYDTVSHYNSIYLDEYMSDYGSVKRSIIQEAKKVDISKGSTRKKYAALNHMPTRLIHSIQKEVEAIIESSKECLLLAKSAKEAKETKVINQMYKIHNILIDLKYKLIDEPDNIKIKEQIHKLKERKVFLNRMFIKLDNEIKDIDKEIEKEVPSIILGTKKLWKEQFYHPKKYKSSEEWKEKDLVAYNHYHTIWKEKWIFNRSNNIYFEGVAADNNGNSVCTPTIQLDGNIELRIRLSDKIIDKYTLKDNYIYMRDLNFGIYHETICKEIALHTSDKKNAKPITIRICKNKDNTYTVHMTIKQTPLPIITSQTNGYIGIDINDGFITGAIVNEDGNIINIKEGLFKISYNLKGKSSNQANNILGNVIAELKRYCLKYNRGICAEKLDFTNLKEKMGSNKAYNRMISSFPYSKFTKMLKSMCEREGIKLKQVNPSYTSMLGRFNYMKELGISVHHAAAIIIARRGMDKSEEIKGNTFIANNGDIISCNLPCRKNYRNKKEYLQSVISIVKPLLKKSFSKSKHNNGLGVGVKATKGTNTITSGTGTGWCVSGVGDNS